MIKSILTVSLIALTVFACTPEQSALDRPPGKYESHTSSTDSAGTTRQRDRSTEVYVDEYGNKKAVMKSKKSTDPKGLFNKSTTKSEEVIEERH